MNLIKMIYWTLSAYYDVLEMTIREKVFKQKSTINDSVKVNWECHRIRKTKDIKNEVISQAEIEKMLSE